MSEYIKIETSAEDHGSITGAPNAIKQSDSVLLTHAEFEAVKEAQKSLTKIHRFIVNEAPIRSMQYEGDIAKIDTALAAILAKHEGG